jgi:hypothetical protein
MGTRAGATICDWQTVNPNLQHTIASTPTTQALRALIGTQSPYLNHAGIKSHYQKTILPFKATSQVKTLIGKLLIEFDDCFQEEYHLRKYNPTPTPSTAPHPIPLSYHCKNRHMC